MAQRLGRVQTAQSIALETIEHQRVQGMRTLVARRKLVSDSQAEDGSGLTLTSIKALPPGDSAGLRRYASFELR